MIWRHRSTFSGILLLIIAISGCLPTPSSSAPERDITREALLFQDTFEDARAWQTYNREGLLMDVAGGQFRALIDLPGRYAWSFADTDRYTNVVIDAKMVVSDGEALYGVMCRGSIQNAGHGYYFLLSHDGAFSIRRGSSNQVEALVPWQNHDAIYSDGRYNRVRAVCDGYYLALYANGTYLGSAQDTRYTQGYTGIIAGQSPDMTTQAQVNVDDFELGSLATDSN